MRYRLLLDPKPCSLVVSTHMWYGSSRRTSTAKKTTWKDSWLLSQSMARIPQLIPRCSSTKRCSLKWSMNHYEYWSFLNCVLKGKRQVLLTLFLLNFIDSSLKLGRKMVLVPQDLYYENCSALPAELCFKPFAFDFIYL